MVDEVVNRRVDVDINVNAKGSEAAINAFAKLVAAQNRYEQALKKSNQTMQQAVSSNGQFRAGLQNVGFQVQDMAVQIAGGQGAVRAFAQQLPQAIGAMQVMLDTTTKLGAFMAGPWGVALGVAAAVLIPFIGHLYETATAADEATGALNALIKARAEEAASARIEGVAQGELNSLYAEQAKLQAYIARQRKSPSGQPQFSYQQQQRLLEVNQRILEIEDTMHARRNAAAAAQQQQIRTQITNQVALETATDNLSRAQAQYAINVQRATDAYEQSTKTQAHQRQLQETLTSEARRLQAAQDAHKAEQEAAAAAKRAADERRREDERSAKEQKKKLDDWNEYIDALNRGGDALAKLAKQEQELNDAIAGRGPTGADPLSAEGRLEAERQLLDIAKQRVELERQRRAASGPMGKAQVEGEKWVETQKELNQLIEQYIILADTTDDDRLAQFYLKQADAARKLLMTEKELAQAQKDKQFQEDSAIYARGGPDVVKLEDQLDYFTKLRDHLGPMSKGFDVLTEKIDETNAALERARMSGFDSEVMDLMVEGINEFAEGMSAAIEGTKSFGEAFEDLAKMMIAELTKLIIKWLLFQAISGLMGGAGGKNSKFLSALGGELGIASKAKGGAFANGNVLPFAQGGVVSQPTIFPMQNGVGLMGEAGAEAIMPLARMSNGNLGVQSTGMNVTVNNYTNSDVTTTQTEDGLLIEIRAAERARQMIAADIRRGDGSVSGALQGTYRLSRSAR